MSGVRPGRLKVYVGAAPGVGETYRMLDEGRRRAARGADVRAVTVCYPEPGDRAQLHALERAWAQWDPGVELVRPACERHSLGRPIAAYVREVAAAEPGTRVTVPIPEAEPERLWQRLLQNQRGAVVAHAVRRETDAVIGRLRFRL